MKSQDKPSTSTPNPILKQFAITTTNGVQACQCLTCNKIIVLRQNSTAVTRLASHINTHGQLVIPGTK